MALTGGDEKFGSVQRTKADRRIELDHWPQAHHEVERFVPHGGQQVRRESFDDTQARAGKLLTEA